MSVFTNLSHFTHLCCRFCTSGFQEREDRKRTSLSWTQPQCRNHLFNLNTLFHLLTRQTYINQFVYQLVQETRKWELSSWDCFLIHQNQQLNLTNQNLLPIHKIQPQARAFLLIPEKWHISLNWEGTLQCKIGISTKLLRTWMRVEIQTTYKECIIELERLWLTSMTTNLMLILSKEYHSRVIKDSRWQV